MLLTIFSKKHPHRCLKTPKYDSATMLIHLACSKLANEDQIEILKKHIEQYKEIGESNEQAIETLTKVKMHLLLKTC